MTIRASLAGCGLFNGPSRGPLFGESLGALPAVGRGDLDKFVTHGHSTQTSNSVGYELTPLCVGTPCFSSPPTDKH